MLSLSVNRWGLTDKLLKMNNLSVKRRRLPDKVHSVSLHGCLVFCGVRWLDDRYSFLVRVRIDREGLWSLAIAE